MGILGELAERLRLKNEAERLRQMCLTCQAPLIVLEMVIVPVFRKFFGIIGSEDIEVCGCQRCFLTVRLPKVIELQEVQSLKRALERSYALYLGVELKEVVKRHMVHVTTETARLRIR